MMQAKPVESVWLVGANPFSALRFNQYLPTRCSVKKAIAALKTAIAFFFNNDQPSVTPLEDETRQGFLQLRLPHKPSLSIQVRFGVVVEASSRPSKDETDPFQLPGIDIKNLKTVTNSV